MTYRINKTDGELLIDLTDGIIDKESTDLTLIGKNYKGFGESINENFVKLLENFASTSPPSNPMIGQMWYDKQDSKLKVYNGVDFKSASGTVVNSSQPTNLIAGDIWIDNLQNKLYLYDGVDLTLVGPNYNANQGKTGFETASQLDEAGTERTILKLFLGGALVGVYSPSTFVIPLALSIPGLSPDPNDTSLNPKQKLYRGFNIANLDGETPTSGFWYNGVSQDAKALLDESGNRLYAVDFFTTTSDSTTQGTITINNSNGLTINDGGVSFANFKIAGNTLQIENQQTGSDLNLRVRQGNNFYNVFYADSSELEVELFKGVSLTTAAVIPTTTVNGNLQVNKDVKISGNLTVVGEQFYVSSTAIQVNDKAIELAVKPDGTYEPDVNIDGGGILLRGTQGTKSLTWIDSTDSWTSNQNLDLSIDTFPTPSYKIGGSQVLNSTTLGSTVINSSLENVGTLTGLDVSGTITTSYFDITGSTITRTNGININIDPGTSGVLSLQSHRISDVTNPVDLQDVTTKNYVDTKIREITLMLSIDVSGLNSPQPLQISPGPTTSIGNILTSMKDPTTVENFAYANVLVWSYTNAVVKNIEITVGATGTGALIQKSYVSVQGLNNSQESVIADIQSGGTAEGIVEFVPLRYLYVYQNQNGVWTYLSRTVVS